MAALGMLADNAIQQDEAHACFVTFELLPLRAKRALKDSRWWVDLFKAKTSPDYQILEQFSAPQLLQWNHLIDSLVAGYFPNSAEPNKYLRMWWVVQQACHEPHAAFIPRVVELWRKWLKGLWDSKTSYMDRYFLWEVLLDNLLKEALVEKVRHLDQNHGLSRRSHHGQFHPR